MKLDWRVVGGADRYTLLAGEYKIISHAFLDWRLYRRGRDQSWLSIRSYQSLQGAKIGASQHAKRHVQTQDSNPSRL